MALVDFSHPAEAALAQAGLDGAGHSSAPGVTYQVQWLHGQPFGDAALRCAKAQANALLQEHAKEAPLPPGLVLRARGELERRLGAIRHG